MNVFRALSDATEALLSDNTTADPIDKQDLLGIIDNNIIGLTTVVETYEQNPDVIKFIQTLLTTKNNTENNSLKTLYDKYLKSLNPKARSLEVDSILKSIYVASKLVLSENKDIRDNFDVVFALQYIGLMLSEIHVTRFPRL